MRKLLLLAPAAAAAIAVAVPSDAAVPAGNLLANAGFEVTPNPDTGTRGTPQGWSFIGGPSDAYDRCYGDPEVPDVAASTAISGGARFAFPGTKEDVSLFQDVTVDPDAAAKTLRFGADLGGFGSQEDRATLIVTALDAQSGILATATVAGPTAAERSQQTGFVHRTGSLVVPDLTRTIHVVVAAHRAEGVDNDGYADNVFATFDAAGEPPKQAPGSCAPAGTPTPTPTPGATPTPTPSPAAEPKLSTLVAGLPGTKRCRPTRRLRLRLRSAVRKATITVDGKRKVTRKGKRVGKAVTFKRLPRGRYTLAFKITLKDGRTVTGTRRLRTCARR